MNSEATFSRRNKLVWLAVATLGLTTAVVPMALRADPPATAPTTRAASLPEPAVKEDAPTPVVATIDGIPIMRDNFERLLMATGGPRLFEQILPVVVVQEACDKAGIEVKMPDAVNAERDRIITNLKKQFPDKTDAERDRILSISLQRQGITNPMEFEFFLERSAYARALAKGKNAPTEEQIQQAWKADNADKVQVVDIVVPNMEAVIELRKIVETDNKSPLDLAQSKNYPMQRIVFSKEQPQKDAAETLWKLAFQLKEKALSADTLIGDPAQHHVMYCEKVTPATKKLMSTADHDELQKNMTEAYELQWSEEHLRKLMYEASQRIDIRDKTLANYYAAQAKAQQEAHAAATSMPAAATAP